MTIDATEPKPCLGPIDEASRPGRALPPGTWDTHFHVFGPLDRFPYAVNRKYTPPPAPLPAYLALAQRLGIARGVCVHPNLHGDDNAVTLDAMQRSSGQLLGMIKASERLSLAQLREMDAAGVRGVRFAFNPQHGGALDAELLDRFASWAEELRWCIDFHMAPDDLEPLVPRLSTLTIPLVIDHFARVDPAHGVNQRPFRVLLDLVRRDHVWVKLSGADRISRIGPPYADVVPFARALIAAAPTRVLWGTDWPHTGYFDSNRMPRDVALADLVFDFAPSEDDRMRLLVDNPKALFERR
jgi:predicted TIM-barrel fold metal-dependent hydrolase